MGEPIQVENPLTVLSDDDLARKYAFCYNCVHNVYDDCAPLNDETRLYAMHTELQRRDMEPRVVLDEYAVGVSDD